MKLLKKEEGWSIKGREEFSADEGKVDAMLGGLSNLHVKEAGKRAAR